MAKRLEARRNLEATFGDLISGAASLAIPNPLTGQPLAVPLDVRLGDSPEGDPAILWRVPPPVDEYGLDARWRNGGSAQQAFWRFLDLAAEDDAARFVEFARRFGVLGLWPYETPDRKRIYGLSYWVPGIASGVFPPLRYTVFHGDEEWRLEEQGLLGMMYEPVAEWRRWADWMRATVNIFRALVAGELSSRNDWTALGWEIFFEPAHLRGNLRNFPKDIRLQRVWLGNVIQERFLRWSGLTPVIRWDSQRPEITLALGGEHAVLMSMYGMQPKWPENCLFPALVAQLVALLISDQPIASCSRCGRVHQRTIKARTDQPVYCSEACQQAARRATKRRSAAKRRAIEKATIETGSRTTY
jgi:hypothetical protein